VYHAAGLAGAGGSSYIDSVILRDRDANTAWEDQADGTLEERVYLCQNWRADVVALMTSDGHLINQVRYDPYGVPFGIAKTDLDGDGDVDGDDATLFATYHGAGTMPFADWNFDGTVDLSDQSAYTSDKNADTGLGRGDPGYAWSHAGGALRKAYAGYEIDPVLTGSEGWESVYHVRHRVYLSGLGRWTRRDPLGYVDGMSLYRHVKAVLVAMDPDGRRPCRGDCGDDEPGPPFDSPDPGFIGPPTLESFCCSLADKGREGATVCCKGRAVICVYNRNIDNAGLHPDVAQKLKECTYRHESIHVGDIDCSKCGFDVCLPGSLPWIERCGGYCSEAEAYAETASCMAELDCHGDATCIADRDKLIAAAEALAGINQYKCDMCKGDGGDSSE
jgi:RHS repeat-associated protein